HGGWPAHPRVHRPPTAAPVPGAREEFIIGDDLTFIEGIGPELAEELRARGVVRFSHIAHWSRLDVGDFAEALELGDGIDRHRWIPQAQALTALVMAEEALLYEAPEDVDHEVVIREHFPGENVKVHGRFGIVYRGTPDVVDRLEEIQGLDGEKAKRLAKLGVFRFKQIANWSAGNVQAIEKRLRLPLGTIATEKWSPQAERQFRETYRSSSVWATSYPDPVEYEERMLRIYSMDDGPRVEGRYGIIFSSPPIHADDLGRIEGLSEKQAEALQSRGVYRYRQIADWSMDNVQAFAERLGVPAQQIFADRWIPQAEHLDAVA
ncbi:MAG: hypothetical protein AAF191_00660, partial [Verrucomicrobiota bacterium]